MVPFFLPLFLQILLLLLFGTKKSRRRTGITKIARVDTPRDVMMQIVEYRNPALLDKYNDRLLLKREEALRAISFREARNYQ